MLKNIDREREPEENKKILMPVMHINLFLHALTAAKEKKGIVCAILCVATVEGLINDIIGWYLRAEKDPVVFPNEECYAYIKEDEKKLLKELKKNIKMPAKVLLLGKWKKDDALYQDFCVLLKIRNGLTHNKPEELSLCEETGIYSGYPKYLKNLLQKKIIIMSHQSPSSWAESLEHSEFCLWCMDTCNLVLRELKNKMPESRTKKYINNTRKIDVNIRKLREYYIKLQNKI